MKLSAIRRDRKIIRVFLNLIETSPDLDDHSGNISNETRDQW